MDYNNYDLEKLPLRKKLEMKYFYPKTKWFYARFYSLYGFYWAYKLIVGNFTIPIWEQWALWSFAMMSLYFFSREHGFDGFFKTSKFKSIKETK